MKTDRTPTTSIDTYGIPDPFAVDIPMPTTTGTRSVTSKGIADFNLDDLSTSLHEMLERKPRGKSQFAEDLNAKKQSDPEGKVKAMSRDIQYLVGQIMNIRELTIDDLRRFVGPEIVDTILAKEALKLKPEPVNCAEEIVINYNELADFLVRQAIKDKEGEFIPGKHNSWYKELLKQYMSIILEHKRGNYE